MYRENVTKWDLMDDGWREAADRTPCRLVCVRCAGWLETEGDFARHFTLYDRTYRNLGYCTRKPRKVSLSKCGCAEDRTELCDYCLFIGDRAWWRSAWEAIPSLGRYELNDLDGGPIVWLY